MIGLRNTYAKSVKPESQPFVNYRHPIAQGLDFLNFSNDYPFDLVKRIDPATGNFVAPASTPAGMGVNGNAGENFSVAQTTHLNYTSNYSVWVLVYVEAVNSGTTDYQDVFGRSAYVSQVNNQGWVFQKVPTADSSDGTPRMCFNSLNNDGNYQLQDSTVVLTAGQYYSYLVTNDGTNKSMYRDGFLRVSNALGATASQSTNGLVCGSVGNSTFRVIASATWSRVLTAQEANELWRDPFCMLQAGRKGSLAAYFGTLYTKTLTETTTMSDTLTRQSTKVLTDTTTMTDTIVKQTQRIFTETITHTDTLIKQGQKILADTITMTGTLLKQAGKVLSDTITHTDTLIKSLARTFSETITSSDTLLKQAVRTLSESITLSDTLSRIYSKIITETITMTDTLLKMAGKVLSDIVTSTDTVIRQTSRILTETVTNTATLLRQTSRTFTETITSTDALTKTANKVLSEVITSTATMIRSVARTLSEIVTMTDTFIFAFGRTLVEVVTLTDSFLSTIKTKMKKGISVLLTKMRSSVLKSEKQKPPPLTTKK